ncbi:coenzyme F430 synthase [Methanocaldococcus indicus]|uniref:coenzyme F430 synthase n=1 Tax=Methanocaldococcus indicus TaxID=213231 RepID=UPI003C6CE17F
MLLLVDVNHGALSLAKYFLEREGEKVAIYDIYKKTLKDENAKKEYLKLKEKYNNITLFLEEPNFEDFEVIAPIHCPIDVNFKNFHEVVSEIINKEYKDKKIICITGVKGKTTTTELIYHILKEDYNIFLHNSNKGSITPTALLNVLDNEDSYEYFIFECSLGLVSCEFGAITNIFENYKIAKNRRDALTAKFSTLNFAKKAYINKRDVEEYKVAIEHSNLHVLDTKTKILNKYPLRFLYDNNIFKFNNSVFGLHYVENSIFAYEICKNFVDTETILKKIETFKINNRMNIEKINNYYVVKNINPGLDVKAIDFAIRDFLEMFKDGDIYVGGDFNVTCEEIDIFKLTKILKKYNTKYYFIGDIGKELLKFIKGVYKNNIEIRNNTLIILKRN